MSFEEKATWVSGVVILATSTIYFIYMATLLAVTPATQIAYQKPMITAIVASIIASIVGMIVVSIATAIPLELREEGSSKHLDRKDERDIHIGRRGELVGYYVASAGAVVVLVLAMIQAPYFWIANILYLSFALSAVVSSAVKIVAYRRGF